MRVTATSMPSALVPLIAPAIRRSIIEKTLTWGAGVTIASVRQNRAHVSNSLSSVTRDQLRVVPASRYNDLGRVMERICMAEKEQGQGGSGGGSGAGGSSGNQGQSGTATAQPKKGAKKSPQKKPPQTLPPYK